MIETEKVNNIDPISKSLIFFIFTIERRLKFWVNRQWKECVGYSGAATTTNPNLTIMPCLDYGGALSEGDGTIRMA